MAPALSVFPRDEDEDEDAWLRSGCDSCNLRFRDRRLEVDATGFVLIADAGRDEGESGGDLDLMVDAFESVGEVEVGRDVGMLGDLGAIAIVDERERTRPAADIDVVMMDRSGSKDTVRARLAWSSPVPHWSKEDGVEGDEELESVVAAMTVVGGGDQWCVVALPISCTHPSHSTSLSVSASSSSSSSGHSSGSSSPVAGA